MRATTIHLGWIFEINARLGPRIIKLTLIAKLMLMYVKKRDLAGPHYGLRIAVCCKRKLTLIFVNFRGQYLRK